MFFLAALLCFVHLTNDSAIGSSYIKNVDQLNSIDGDIYPPNQPKQNFGQIGLTH